MADIIYRETDVKPTRSNSSVKATPLTNAELDGNLKLIDEDLKALRQGGVDDRSLVANKLELSGVNAGEYGSATKVAKVTVNDSGLVTAASEVSILFSLHFLIFLHIHYIFLYFLHYIFQQSFLFHYFF